VTVQVKTTGGAVAQERVRVITGFPISVEHGSPPAGFNLDTVPYTRRPEYLTDADAAVEVHEADTIAVNHIFDCAIHTYKADHARSASEILRRYDLSRYHEPAIPCSQHLCRVRPETAYALFGELTDILRTNPNINSGFSHGNADSPEETVARITRDERQL